MTAEDWMWTLLSTLLQQRTDRGWRIAVDHADSPIEQWLFGIDTAMLVADIDASRRFHLFVHNDDIDLFFGSIAEFEAVLDSYERKNRGLTELQQKILASDDIGLPPELLARMQEQVAVQNRALDLD